MVSNISFQIIKEITKFRLSLSVVFSSFISYLLGAAEVNYIQLFYLISGGILIVSSSNIFNQIIERDLDKLMKRTQNRPLPKNEITPNKNGEVQIIKSIQNVLEECFEINLEVNFKLSQTRCHTSPEGVGSSGEHVRGDPWAPQSRGRALGPQFI